MNNAGWIADLRGCNPAGLLVFTPDDMPPRLLSTIPGTPAWTIAPYEIRRVAASAVPGIAVGDMVLFSRVEKDISVCAENPTVKG